ncbi:polyadenylate-binding protein 2 [Encephalitozoon intestinalis ATCC 50506]|uniref:Polyadenylate-binding protein 2 n=1 Tax=Encephalitozoon intestinalis (strain ATCC 50506) TaxID=876142 RepID=E0S9P6_ENCIT|nr:polyadenylate-binding protein 2 [Encephalitozoon intestinalis ATCC 50506]ADM12431.2 polyadenylate-binding protein 2 [Encephalitozoon intestinalis ATCC 50506]UTX46266.1 polyadenylate-binding protein [Encephalitozoon intestinalis]
MEIDESKRASSDSLTIYVGDLSPKTLDSDLFRIFSNVGKVLNVKLIKRGEPVSSFAFVTFENEEEAERAIREYKHYELHNRQIRVMRKDERPPETGNIFVKNLPENFTSKDLDDAFSMFGEITSCKVATTSHGKSKGYGFVQFKEKKAAKKVIKNFNNLNGLMLGENKIVVELYNPEMKKGENKKTPTMFTNCFIKNFPVDVEEENLRELLEKYGKVTSLFFPTKEDGKPKGFAFANFESHECALNAIKNLHETFPFGDGESGEPFYIQKGQRKEERAEELRKTFEQLSMQGQSYKKNLYITNIPEGFGAEELNNIFREFGNITSMSVGTDGANSQKQYAYVCYSTPEEASIAVERGNEIYLDGNRLQVAYFKNKLERMKEKEFGSIGYKPNIPYMYNQGVNFVPNGFKRERNRGGSAKGYSSELEKLHGLVLAEAPSFKSQWKSFGVNNEAEFTSKVTRAFRNKSEEEIKDMIDLDFVLAKSIAAVIENDNSSD